MNDGRGMKKWAPFQSLIEQSETIAKMKKEKAKVDKPIISEERFAKINNILQNYHKQILNIKYYKNGKILEIENAIKRIDTYNHQLIIDEDTRIAFKNIIDINDKDSDWD